MTDEKDRIKCEAKFFDKRVAEKTQDDDLRVSVDLVLLDSAQFPFLDHLRGMRILDCGCGSGLVSIWFALKGASVNAFDISRQSVSVTLQRAALSGLRDRVLATLNTFEDLPYRNETFDFVVGKFILHHVNVARSGAEAYRVLKKGGRALFYENNSRNPILMFFRRFVVGSFGIPKLSTNDEYPLTPKQVRLIGEIFGGHYRCHYLSFFFFSLLDQQVLRGRAPFIGKLLRSLDQLIYHYFTPLRPFGYYQLIELQKGNGSVDGKDSS